jgi:hypothetical protein
MRDEGRGGVRECSHRRKKLPCHSGLFRLQEAENSKLTGKHMLTKER